MWFKKKKSFLYDVYLGGTCNHSKWREKLISLPEIANFINEVTYEK